MEFRTNGEISPLSCGNLSKRLMRRSIPEQHQVSIFFFFFPHLWSNLHSVLQLVGTIVSEYGTADPDLLQEKLIKAMMIVENFELPSAFADVIVKPQNKPVIAENTVDQSQDSKEDAQTARAKAEEVISEPAVSKCFSLYVDSI